MIELTYNEVSNLNKDEAILNLLATKIFFEVIITEAKFNRLADISYELFADSNFTEDEIEQCKTIVTNLFETYIKSPLFYETNYAEDTNEVIENFEEKMNTIFRS